MGGGRDGGKKEREELGLLLRKGRVKGFYESKNDYITYIVESMFMATYMKFRNIIDTYEIDIMYIIKDYEACIRKKKNLILDRYTCIFSRETTINRIYRNG